MSQIIQESLLLIKHDTIFQHLTDLKQTNNNQVASIVIKELLKLLIDSDLSFQSIFFMSDSCTSFIWERLNTGHWSEVSMVWRHLFTLAMLLKIQVTLKILKETQHHNYSKEILVDLIKMCDVATFMGAPLSRCDNICSKIASLLSNHLSSTDVIAEVHQKFHKKPKIDFSFHLHKFQNVLPIHVEDCLSLETFIKDYKSKRIPVLISGAITEWPALEVGGSNYWSPQYLKRIAGYRTVPIELGRRYTDDSWTQKLMTIGQFIKNYIETSENGAGYLAQYQLFDQVIELRDDFDVPEYCYTGDSDVDINCWIGPKGTVSPLHTDPRHNCLAQVVGSKHVVLFPEDQSQFLSAIGDGMLTNTSQIDLELSEDEILKEFPEFGKSLGFECILQPGEILYIPPKCWHFVKSLSTSFSINFWFE